MSYTVKEKVNEGSARIRGSLTGGNEYERTFVVSTDDTNANEFTVAFAAGIPRRGTALPYGDPSVSCLSVSPTRVSDGPTRSVWEVTCGYGPTPRPDFQMPGADDAEDLDPEVSTSWTDKTTYLIKDRSKKSKPFLNSAGEPYGPEVAAVEDGILIITISRYERTLPWNVITAYSNAMNSDRWAYWAKHCCKSRVYGNKVKLQTKNGQYVWMAKVTYEIAVDRDGWDRHAIDQGSYYWEKDANGNPQVGVDGQKVYPTDKDGQAATAPVLLDGEGGLLSEALTKAMKFYWHTFQVYHEQPFRRLGLERYI